MKTWQCLLFSFSFVVSTAHAQGFTGRYSGNISLVRSQSNLQTLRFPRTLSVNMNVKDSGYSVLCRDSASGLTVRLKHTSENSVSGQVRYSGVVSGHRYSEVAGFAMVKNAGTVGICRTTNGVFDNGIWYKGLWCGSFRTRVRSARLRVKE